MKHTEGRFRGDKGLNLYYQRWLLEKVLFGHLKSRLKPATCGAEAFSIGKG